MVGLAVPVVLDRINLAARATDTARSVRVAGQVGALIQNIQQERLLSLGYLIHLVDRPTLEQQVERVTEEVSTLRADPDVTDLVRSALDHVQDLAAVRAAIENDDETVLGTLISLYAAVDTRLIDSLRLDLDIDTETAAGRQVVGLDAVLRADECISAGASWLIVLITTKQPDVLLAYEANLAIIQVHIDRFTKFSTPAQVALYNDIQAQLNKGFGDKLPTTAGSDPMATISQIPLVSVFPSLQQVVAVGRNVETKIINDVTGAVAKEKRQALTTAYAVGGVALLVLLIAAMLSIGGGPRRRPAADPAHRAPPTGSPGSPRRSWSGSPTTRPRSPVAVRLEPVDVRGRRRDRRPGPGLRTGAEHRRPAGRAAGGRAGATSRRCSATSAGAPRTWSAGRSR